MLNFLNRQMKLPEPLLQRFLLPFEASLADEDLYLSALFAYGNMLKVGTTCFADDGGPRPEVMAPALERIGIRGILARSTLDQKEGIQLGLQDTLPGIRAKAESLFASWHGKAGGRIRIWMGMRQIMVCSEELLREIKCLADQLRTGIHIHLGEGTYEVDYAIRQVGLRPAEYLDSVGFLGKNVHAAHSVYLSERELDIYRDNDVSVAHCPAVAYIHMGPTKVISMLRRGLRVGIGSDGALQGSLDLFHQMHVSYIGQVAAFGLPYSDRGAITPEDLLALATIGGASALHWADEIGSLEVGKKADILVLAGDDLDLLPCYDPVYAVSYNARAAQVRTVLVDGQVVVEDGHLTLVDEDELKERVKERSPEILSHFLQVLERKIS